MKKQILFIQGGGEDGYEADQPMVASLQKALGDEYEIHYPKLKSDDTKPDFGWISQIADCISESNDNTILVAHSFGASMILKYFSEHSAQKKIAGIFLLATPFWEGDEDWQQGLKLKKDFAEKLSKNIPMHVYHCRDDEEIGFSHFEKYQQKISIASFHVVKKGGHQFDNNLEVLVPAIKNPEKK